jgi:hypothetical protein
MSRHVSSASSSSSSDTAIDPEQECASDTTLSDGDGDGDPDGSLANSQFPAYPIHLLSACSAAGRPMCQYTQSLVVERTDGSRGELSYICACGVNADADADAGGRRHSAQRRHVQQRGVGCCPTNQTLNSVIALARRPNCGCGGWRLFPSLPSCHCCLTDR